MKQAASPEPRNKVDAPRTLIREAAGSRPNARERAREQKNAPPPVEPVATVAASQSDVGMRGSPLRWTMNALGPGGLASKPWLAALAAIVSTLAALGLRLALDTSLEGRPTLVIFIVAIMMSAYSGGLHAGLLATLLSYFAASHFLLPALYPSTPASGADRWQQALFMLAGIVISVLNESLHRAYRRTDAALRELRGVNDRVQGSRQRLRDLFDGLGPSMFVGLLTPRGILLEVNRSPLTAAGLTPEDVLGKPFDETYWWSHSPESRRKLREAIARAALGEEFRYDVRTRGIGDEIIDIDFSLRPLRDAAGNVAFLVPSATVITERKRAEAELRRSERELRDAVSRMAIDKARLVTAQATTKTGSWEADLSTFQVNWSEETYRILELSPDTNQPSQQAFLEAIHPDDRIAMEEALVRSYDDRGVTVFEHRLLMPDGRVKFVEERWQTFVDADGLPLHASGTCQDISDRRQVDEALRASEERFRSYFELGLIGMAVMSPDKRNVEVNDELCRILGYERHELLAKTWQELTHPDDVAAYEAQFSRVMKGESDGYTLDKRWIRKDGRIIDSTISVKCLRRPDGSVDYLVKLVQDVTERKRAEATRDRLAAILESTTDLVSISDRSGSLVYLNRAGRSLLGVGLEEDITQTRIVEFIPDPPTHPILTEGIPAAVRDGTWSGETVLLSRDGRLIPVSQVILAHAAPGTDVDFLSSIMRDVSERTLAEAALRALSQETERRERLLNIALASASDFIQIYDRDGRLLFVNQPLLDLWGLTLDAVVGKNFFDLGYPADLAGRLQRQLDQVFNLRQRVTDETSYTNAAGLKGYYEYIFSPIYEADGTVGLVVGSTREISERRRAENALLASQLRYRSLFENMLEGYAYCQMSFENGRPVDFVYLEVNGAFEKITGLKNVIGKPVTALIPGIEASREYFEIYGRVATTGRAEEFETYIEGFGKWLAIAVYSTEQGYFVAVFDDITDRKLAQAALQATLDEFRTLSEAMPQIVWITTADGYNTYFNQRWTDYTGLSLEQSYGHGWNTPFHPDDQKRAFEAWENATASVGTYELECRLRRADGSYRWWLIRGVPLRNSDGTIAKWVGTCTDIHQLKLAEQELSATSIALQRQQTELRVLFDLMPAMIWFKDTQNRILRVNQRVADQVGKSVQEIEGRMTEQIYPANAARFYAEDLQVIRSGTPKLGFVEMIRNGNGAEIWVQTDKVPYRGNDGMVVGLVIMAQDITERRLSEAALEKSNTELIEVSRRAGMAEIATNVLHNVGNVLNSVNVSASLVIDNVRSSRANSMARVMSLMREHKGDLGRYFTDDPKGRHIPAFLEQVSAEWQEQQRAAIEELMSLRANIDHIKEIVAMQQTYAKPFGTAETANIVDLVEQSLRMERAVLAERHVHLLREFDEVPAISVEKHQVLQILVNLLHNAAIACDELDESNRRITVRVARVEGRIRISVSDNGVGIAPENLTRIFAHGFTTRKDGHGFGLHSGALAASSLGGSLGAHSLGPGRGATFTLDLPMHPPGVRS